MKFKLLCIDMFQTLVDVNTRIPFIWKRILKDEYSETRAYECAKSVSKHVFYGFHQNASSNVKFVNLKCMFRDFFHAVLEEMHISFDADEAVKIFMDEHTKAREYEDVKSFFDAMKNKMPICLVSDADVEMIMPIINKYEFDQVFISEKAKSYKNEPNSKIFKDVLKHYEISPDQVLHIGDSSSDIIGANRVGIKTCWINRDNLTCRYDIQPDYIVKSLRDIVKIIDSRASMLA